MVKSYEYTNWLSIIIIILVVICGFLTIFFTSVGDTIMAKACESGIITGSACLLP